MKNLSILLAVFVIIAVASTTAQAQFKKGYNPSDVDTTQDLSVDQFLNPATDFYGLTSNGNYNNFAITSDRLKLNSPTKFLLKLGTGILRGSLTNWENDNIPLYSYENAWKYPGKTIRYPESFSEYEGFLERYKRYASEN